MHFIRKEYTFGKIAFEKRFPGERNQFELLSYAKIYE